MKDVNPEILHLVIADQWDRGNDMFGKGQVKPPSDDKGMKERDAARQRAVRDLLAADKLKSGNDFNFASLIFQHGSNPSDYMLAHVLSVTAVSMGAGSKWMMAATLDPYLQSIKQPQVFGTQFLAKQDHGWTMEPYTRDAISDAERALWCVVPLTQQEKALNELRKGTGDASTEMKGCR